MHRRVFDVETNRNRVRYYSFFFLFSFFLSFFFFLIKNACFEIINLSASKRTGYQFQFESTFRVSLARSTIFGRFNGDPREHWT